ncbi:hypothetical protein CPB86DRAFT_877751 [Serendipita vermifera]|nr:hypothetical protein CPB86DRAFT_877751 [Serendipita vermifera]
MVKTATNPVVESTAAARSATERAKQTNDTHDIQEAISEWEKVIHMIVDSGPSQDHADLLASYAESLLLRWNLAHQDDDIRAVVSILESALEKLPPLSTKARYDLMIRLATVHESWYRSSKNNPAPLTNAIRYWEDAYGLSAVLRRMNEAANEILPSLANACFVAFQDEISGIDSLNQATHYYQVALIHIVPELQTQLRLELGKVYLELMCYSNEMDNAQLAIDCFEVVLKQSKEKDKLIEASNGKSQAWWWKLSAPHESEGSRTVFTEETGFPFREWTKTVSRTYREDAMAAYYHSLSVMWMTPVRKEHLIWSNLASSFLRLTHQSPPLGLHYIHPWMTYCVFKNLSDEKRTCFENLPLLVSALEQFELFTATTTTGIHDSREVKTGWKQDRHVQFSVARIS